MASKKKALNGDGVLYIWQKIKSGFVLKESGKGLSTNDLTNTLKAKYDTAAQKVDELTETGGAPNVIEIVKVNGTPLTPDGDKAVDITVPTKTSQLTNNDNTVKDANYVHTDNNYTTTEKNKLAGLSNYDDTEIRNQIAAAGKIDTIKVNGTAQTVTNKTVELTIPTNNNQLANGAGYQTASQVNTAIQAVVGSAPDALNTLKELADALGNDKNFAATVTAELAKKADKTSLASKQDKLESGTNIKTVGNKSLLGTGDIPIVGTFTPNSTNLFQYEDGIYTEKQSDGTVSFVVIMTGADGAKFKYVFRADYGDILVQRQASSSASIVNSSYLSIGQTLSEDDVVNTFTAEDAEEAFMVTGETIIPSIYAVYKYIEDTFEPITNAEIDEIISRVG